jgi:hypothetical protein
MPPAIQVFLWKTKDSSSVQQESLKYYLQMAGLTNIFYVSYPNISLIDPDTYCFRVSMSLLDDTSKGMIIIKDNVISSISPSDLSYIIDYLIRYDVVKLAQYQDRCDEYKKINIPNTSYDIASPSYGYGFDAIFFSPTILSLIQKNLNKLQSIPTDDNNININMSDSLTIENALKIWVKEITTTYPPLFTYLDEEKNKPCIIKESIVYNPVVITDSTQTVEPIVEQVDDALEPIIVEQSIISSYTQRVYVNKEDITKVIEPSQTEKVITSTIWIIFGIFVIIVIVLCVVVGLNYRKTIK